MEEFPTKSELSDRVSKDMKKRGFKFIGTTIIYSYLEAVGVIDDHMEGCGKNFFKS
jgi:DNA-3-methyladenine glycosylase I